MSDRTDTRDSAARTEEAEAPIEEALEDASEDARDDAPAQEAGELEEVVAAALVDEEDEEDNEKAEAAIEAELEIEIEDETAINEGAVLDVLLRRSGVLPEHTETSEFDDETELPAGRREGEFVCSSCFLIKPNSQMGDADRRMCRDYVDPPQAKHVA
jgi:hypothetical protein